MVTQAQLRSLVHYDPKTGVFINIATRGKNKIARIGMRSDNPHPNGYRYMMVLGKTDYAHRWAFLYMTGEIPRYIDHHNLIKDDNRWDNLRACSMSQNLHNIAKPRHNKSGLKGVSFAKASGKWKASMKINRKTVHLGLYDTVEEAKAAYDKAASNVFGDFARV